MLVFSFLFILKSKSVIYRRDTSKFYNLVCTLTTLSSTVIAYSILEFINYNGDMVLKTFLIFIYIDILITLHHFLYNCFYKSDRYYSYSSPFIAFFAMFSKKLFLLVFNIISLAMYNNYQNITFK